MQYLSMIFGLCGLLVLQTSLMAHATWLFPNGEEQYDPYASNSWYPSGDQGNQGYDANNPFQYTFPYMAYSGCTYDLTAILEASDGMTCEDMNYCLRWIDYCKSVSRCLGVFHGTQCSESDKRQHTGQSFFFTFLSNYKDRGSPFLFITSKTTTTATVRIPYLGMEQTYTIDGYKEIDLPKEFLHTLSTSRSVATTGVQVVSVTPVSVYIQSSYNRSADGTVILPTDLLSTSYIIDTHFSIRYGSPEIAVTATADNTFVELKLASGKSENITLNKFDVFTLRLPDLSGTIVTATAPVNVQAGHSCANSPEPSVSHCDFLSTEVVPTANLQQTYVVPYMYPRQNYSVGVTAPFDGTVVTIFDQYAKEIESGPLQKQESVFRTYTDGSITIASSKPVLVTQYGHGSNRTGGDPSLTMIPAPQQFTNYYKFIVSDEVFTYNVLCVIIYGLYDVTGLRLNGYPIYPAETQVIRLPCTGFFHVIYTTVENGNYLLNHINSVVKFGAFLYARADSLEYVTHLGLELENVDEPPLWK